MWASSDTEQARPRFVICVRTEQHEHGADIRVRPCLEWGPNPRSDYSSGWRYHIHVVVHGGNFICHLLSCSLLNDVDSSSDCVVSNCVLINGGKSGRDIEGPVVVVDE